MNLFKVSKNWKKNGIKKFSFLISLLFTIFMIASCDFLNVNINKNDTSDPSPISVEIERTSGAELNFIMTNEGSKDVYFSSHDVPFSSKDPNDPNIVQYRVHLKQYFKITDEYGSEIPYVGMYAMMEQTREMWKLIKSGESISFNVNLFGEYDFPESGNYKIEFISPVTVMDINAIDGRAVNEDGEFIPGEDGQANTVNSNEIEGPIDLENAVDTGLETRGTSGGCGSSQNSYITSARSKAKSITGQASSYIKSKKTDSKWTPLFGSANTGRYNFTVSGITKINGALSKGWAYNCPTNGNGAIAWVYKGSPYQVWLTPAFFSGGTNKLKFNGTVLAHEASHWNAVISTNDYAYYGDCAGLAKSSPDKAIHNADSYRQYIMNTSN
jgi:hypothetical protein